MNIIERADMCLLQMRQLRESVAGFEPHKEKYFIAGYLVGKNEQTNKTAIKRQITSLRQSLLALEKEVCDEQRL